MVFVSLLFFAGIFAVQKFTGEPKYTEVNPGGNAVLKCEVENIGGECRWQKDGKVSTKITKPIYKKLGNIQRNLTQPLASTMLSRIFIRVALVSRSKVIPHKLTLKTRGEISP